MGREHKRSRRDEEEREERQRVSAADRQESDKDRDSGRRHDYHDGKRDRRREKLRDGKRERGKGNDIDRVEVMQPSTWTLEKTRKMQEEEEEEGVTTFGSPGVAIDNNKSAETLSHLVYTEIGNFICAHQLKEETEKKPEGEVTNLNRRDQVLKPKTEAEREGPTEVSDNTEGEHSVVETVPDAFLHEGVVGKGLSGAVKLFRERGELKNSTEWAGRSTDKKKSKLLRIHENDGPMEIHTDKFDKHGRMITQKEEFRLFSHKFHGKGPGKRKLMRRHQQELKLKQVKN